MGIVDDAASLVKVAPYSIFPTLPSISSLKLMMLLTACLGLIYLALEIFEKKQFHQYLFIVAKVTLINLKLASSKTFILAL